MFPANEPVWVVGLAVGSSGRLGLDSGFKGLSVGEGGRSGSVSGTLIGVVGFVAGSGLPDPLFCASEAGSILRKKFATPPSTPTTRRQAATVITIFFFPLPLTGGRTTSARTGSAFEGIAASAIWAGCGRSSNGTDLEMSCSNGIQSSSPS